jgi:hypothetical protein
VTGGALGIGRDWAIRLAEAIEGGCFYLASDEAQFVTGTELVIDCAYTAQ